MNTAYYVAQLRHAYTHLINDSAGNLKDFAEGLISPAIQHFENLYENPGTVVVPLVEVNGGLLLVRRKLADGYGKLALPGGYQAIGETWQEAGAREVFEETGIKVRPSDLTITGVDTVQDGKVNLIFCQSLLKITGEPKPQEDEVLEVVIANRAPDPAEVAFPTHWARINAWFMIGKDLLFPADNHD